VIGWGDGDLADEQIVGACTYVVGAEPCGTNEELTLLDGRVLCEEHRQAVLERRDERRRP
jgi:hypothetical protein